VIRPPAFLVLLLLGAACRSVAPPLTPQPAPPTSPIPRSSARSAAAPVELPARYDEGRWYVAPVTAKGETLLFYADSGGGVNMLLAPTVERLGLERKSVELDGEKMEVVEFPALSPGKSVPLPSPQGPGGGKLLVMPYEGEARQMFPPGADGLPRASGFLGEWWFADRVWTFDYPGHHLFLRSPGDLPAHTPEHQAALGFQTGEDGRRTSQFARIQAEIDGETLDFLFDTGATTLLTDAALATLGDGRPAERGASFITASTFARWHAKHPEWRVIEKAEKGSGEAMIEVPAVRVGGYTVGPVWFTRRADANFHVRMFQWMDRPSEGALGGSAFQYLRVTVDYPGAVAVFEKP
jgi:hypothetical protein